MSEQLSAEERDALADVVYDVDHVCMETGTWEQGRVIAAVERILAARLASRDARLAAVEALEALFAGGPDTPCRTTWRTESGVLATYIAVECVEVPLAALRASLHQDPSEARDQFGLREGSCNCAHYGSAKRCPVHTQEDFDAADQAIGRPAQGAGAEEAEGRG